MKDDVTATEKPKQAATRNGGASDAGAWFSGYNQAMENWAQANAGLMKGAAELSQEMMTFAQSRFQAGIDAWQTAVACRTPADFFENQRELAEKATARCFDDTQRFVSHALAVMNDAAAPFRQEPPAKR
jgi:hypothetical protein